MCCFPTRMRHAAPRSGRREAPAGFVSEDRDVRGWPRPQTVFLSAGPVLLGGGLGPLLGSGLQSSGHFGLNSDGRRRLTAQRLSDEASMDFCSLPHHASFPGAESWRTPRTPKIRVISGEGHARPPEPVPGEVRARTEAGVSKSTAKGAEPVRRADVTAVR